MNATRKQDAARILEFWSREIRQDWGYVQLANIATLRQMAGEIGLGDLSRSDFDECLRAVQLRRVAITDTSSVSKQDLADSLQGLGNEVFGWFAV